MMGILDAPYGRGLHTKDHAAMFQPDGITPFGVPTWYGGVTGALLYGDSMTANLHSVTQITSSVRSGGVVTAASTNHGMFSGQLASIQNMADSTYNAIAVPITRIDANTFTYPAPGVDGSSGDLGAAYSRIAINLSTAWDRGYLTWLNNKTGGALRNAVNAGVSGQTSAQMLARFNKDCLAYPAPRLVILWTGYNDFANQHMTAATVFANVESMALQALANGKMVVIISCIPWTTGGTTTDRKQAIVYNRMMRDFCNSKPGLFFANAANYILDTTNATPHSPLPGMLNTDGIHPIARGAERVAQSIMDVIGWMLPKASRLVMGPADNYGSDTTNANIIDAAPWVSSGGTISGGTGSGTVAGGYVLTVPASCTAVASVVTRPDGVGINQRVVATPGATNAFFQFGPAGNTLFTRGPSGAGGKLRFIGEVSITGVAGSTFKGFNVAINDNLGNPIGYPRLMSAPDNNGQPQADQIHTVISEDIVIPSGPGTSFSVLLTASFSASGPAVTFDIGRWSVERVA